MVMPEPPEDLIHLRKAIFMQGCLKVQGDFEHIMFLRSL